MSKTHPMHGDDRIQSTLYGTRSLERTLPGLARLLHGGMNILDIGCGPGSITADVAAAVRPGRVVGIDAEQSSLDRASALAKERGLENLFFVLGDAYRIPLADASFDLAYANNVMQWLRDPVACLREMARATRPGGRVAVEESDWGTVVMHPEGHATTYYGDARMVKWVHDLMILHLELEGPHGHLNRRMIKDGIIEESLLGLARSELDEAFAYPNFFGSMTSFFVNGLVAG